MTLKDGSVGIGTTSPGAKLEVAGQIKITGGTPGTGKILTSDASGLASWAAAPSAPFAPTDIKVTTATHNGNFGGYVAMKTWIQTNGCSGYHVCDNVEMIRWVQTGGTVTSTCRYSTGIRGYAGAYSDCNSWRDGEGVFQSSIWIPPDGIYSTYCSDILPVCCCK
jgi:hypothetical protein